MNDIEECWNSYKESAVPKTAGTTQVNETKKAFYAGASWMFSHLVHNCCENDGDEYQKLANLDREITEFMSDALPKSQGTA